LLDSVHDKSGGVGGGTFGVSYDVLHGGGSSSEFDGHPGIAWPGDVEPDHASVGVWCGEDWSDDDWSGDDGLASAAISPPQLGEGEACVHPKSCHGGDSIDDAELEGLSGLLKFDQEFDPDSDHGLFGSGSGSSDDSGPGDASFPSLSLDPDHVSRGSHRDSVCDAAVPSLATLNISTRISSLSLVTKLQRSRERKVDDGKDEMDPRDNQKLSHFCRIFDVD
jgi:hypothetical protein